MASATRAGLLPKAQTVIEASFRKMECCAANANGMTLGDVK